ncbi:Cation/H+ exchanger [Corchorus capsularis]|uniref:Cation/H+ exchanger n=1 Tax=Corchorus capsularis TaxID=210143 RepID=A0A1R3ITJ3_COCAP|nr:Cation/H+ exchanger [Corchorus capsularis]
MAGIVLCGLITDACGSHSIVGAFMLGVVMPNEDIIKRKIVDKLDDFVAGILMPLFFLTNGLRTNARYMASKTSWMMIWMVIVVSWAAKVVSVFIVTLFYRMPPKEGLVLGLLMNTKGVLALIIINTGRNIKALNNQSYPLMVLSILAMTALIEPIISFTYKPARHIVEHKNRTIQRLETNSELKILACLHSMRNLMGTLGLLDLSHSPNQTLISVIAIHLLELSERATTGMLIVHDEYRGTGTDSSRAKTETSQIVSAFENFGQIYEGMTIQTMTVVSPYTTMHMDICSLAEDKCVNLIVLPFHRELKPDGKIGDGDPNFTEVNENVFINAPCSVGLLIDRGIGSKRFDSQNISAKFAGQIAMVFIGGPDDREALAYAWKMAAGHVQVHLTVARFLPAKDPMKSNLENKIPNEVDREKQIDDDYIEELKLKTSMNNIVWINFVDKIVNSGDETLAALKAMGDGFALYVIGRRKGEESLVTSGLSDWGCCPELGTLGDTLGSSNFAWQSSILIVQQYISNDGNDDTSEDSCLVARDRE